MHGEQRAYAVGLVAIVVRFSREHLLLEPGDIRIELRLREVSVVVQLLIAAPSVIVSWSEDRRDWSSPYTAENSGRRCC